MRYLIFIFFLALNTDLFCQPNQGRLSWISLGLGGFSDDTYTGPTDDKGGISLFLSANFFKPVLSLDQGEISKLNHGFEVRFLNHFMTINESKLLHYYDFDLLYGLSMGSFVRFDISGGIGFLKYDKELVVYPSLPYTTVPYSGYEKHYTANFPFEAGLTLAPFNGFGLGAGFFANLNGQKSVNGFFFKLDFGKIR